MIPARRRAAPTALGNSQRPLRRVGVLFWAALALALLVRTPGITDRGPWLDEQVSLLGAIGVPFSSLSATPGQLLTPNQVWVGNDWRQVVHANQLSNGANAVLYQLLLHQWLRWFGPSDASARMLSMVFGMGIIVVAYYLGREVAGPHAGVPASLLCAVHPMLIRYSQEVRPYAMATFLMLAATLLLLRVLTPGEAPRRRLLLMGYAVAVALALPTHLLVAPLLAGHFLLVCFAHRTVGWRGYVAALGLAFALLLPWLAGYVPEGLAELASRSAYYRQQVLEGNPDYWWVHPASPRYLVGGALGASLAMFGYVIPSPRVAVSAVALVVPVLAMWLAARTPGEDRWRGLLLPGLAGLPFAGLTALSAGHDLSFQALYFNFYAPLVMVALAGAWVALGRANAPATRLLAPIHAALIVVSLLSSAPPMLDERRPNPLARLTEAIRGDDRIPVVEVPSRLDAELLAFYLGPGESPRLRITGDETSAILPISSAGTPLYALRVEGVRVRRPEGKSPPSAGKLPAMRHTP